MQALRITVIVFILPVAFIAALNIIYYALNNWVALFGAHPGPQDMMTAIALLLLVFIPIGWGFAIYIKWC